MGNTIPVVLVLLQILQFVKETRTLVAVECFSEYFVHFLLMFHQLCFISEKLVAELAYFAVRIGGWIRRVNVYAGFYMNIIAV